MNTNTCCFIGHRTINKTKKLRAGLTELIEQLITKEGIDTFLFGSKSEFDSLCLELVTKAKEKHPHIKRIYMRAEYPIIDDSYKSYLLSLYDDTYYPEKILGAGRAVYVERNCLMTDNSRICVFYYDEAYASANRKSGTKTALEYARSCGKEIVLV